MNFFLEGLTDVALEGARVSRSIVELRDDDRQKIAMLNRSSENGLKLLTNLYKTPIVNVAGVSAITGLSRPNANKLVEKMVQIGILEQLDKDKDYGRSFIHKKYWDLFERKQGTQGTKQQSLGV